MTCATNEIAVGKEINIVKKGCIQPNASDINELTACRQVNGGQ